MDHNFSSDAQKLVGSSTFKISARTKELESLGLDIIHFEIGDPDFNTPSHVIDTAIDSLRRGDTHYVNPSGIFELREAICQSTFDSLGWEPAIDQVVVAPAKSFIYFVVKALVNPGEAVIVADPSYSSYFSTFDFIGVKAKIVPLHEKNSFKMKVADLEKVITPECRLLILNSPGNPTGAVISGEDLAEIYKLCQKNNIYILSLSDEIYSKMVYDKPHESISIHDHCKERTIILNGFSKAYAMTGWRLGYAIAPIEIAKKLGLMVEMVISNVPPFIQHAGVAALKGDQTAISSLLFELKKRRDILVDGINAIPSISCILPEGAFYAFVNIKETGMTSLEFSKLALDKAGVAVLPGTDFGANGEGYVRLAFVTSTAKITEGVNRLSALLNNKV
ncbi:MAG: pyridoxal phosphate-dependent aminotransferase [bacterium]|nr:pyridoxal phosphate-dependent aminotransferase [bacterium]